MKAVGWCRAPPPPGFAMVKCGDLNKRMYGGALQLHASFVKRNTFFLCVICVCAPGAFAHWWTGSPKSLPWFLPVALKSTQGQITPPPPPGHPETGGGAISCSGRCLDALQQRCFFPTASELMDKDG